MTRRLQKALLDGVRKNSLLQVQFNINELFGDPDFKRLAETHLYAAKVQLALLKPEVAVQIIDSALK